MRIATFAPNPEVVSVHNGEAILLPSILGGSLYQVDGNGNPVRSDLAQRAEGLADLTGKTVIALQRLTAEDVARRPRRMGMPEPYSEYEYDDLIAETYGPAVTRTMEEHGLQRLDVLAVSAAGPVGLRLAADSIVPIERLVVFDSTGMRIQPRAGAFARWAGHMVSKEVRRPEHMRNGNPLPYDVQSEAGSLTDMWMHQLPWTSAMARNDANRLAAGEERAVKLYFAESSFTVGSLRAVRELAGNLNMVAARHNQGFRARVAPVQHTITDDYAALARVYGGSAMQGYLR